MRTDLSENLHLLWRAGFGPSADDMSVANLVDTSRLYSRLQKGSAGKPAQIAVATNGMNGLMKGFQELGKMKELSRDQRAQLRKENREGIKDLNLRWMQEMVESKAQLREKMAFFWHGHFACRQINVFFQQQLLEQVRTHALSDFKTLLREVSRSAAMLAFLNNQQNRKQQPNENFAREVMELFTLGRGHYTENDIREAARAFTGWGFDLSGQFVFRKQFHDAGSKTIFGRTGHFDGDDVLDMLLENKQTAKFITAKICRFLVHEKADDAIVNELAGYFYQSGYNISSLLDKIFLSSWFYDKKNIGTKIKSPIELIVGVRRMLPMEFDSEDALLLFQRLLGQVLFFPPNVAGWPGGNNWIDSSSLMYRLRLPGVLRDDESIAVKPKDDDDFMMGQNDQGGLRRKMAQKGVAVQINWQRYNAMYKDVPKERLGISIAGSLLQARRINFDLLQKYADKSDRESYIRSFTMQVMSLPEYQLM